MENFITSNWTKIIDYMMQKNPSSTTSIFTFINPLTVYSIDDSDLTFLVNGNEQITKFINDRYSDIIDNAIIEVTGKKFNTINFISNDNKETYEKKLEEDNIRKERSNSANLIHSYTFDSFIVGDNNRLAHAASLAVSEAPGEVYNPLFIYGGVGLGKTHLMHSIGNNILEKDTSKKVLYVTSEKFTNELIESIRSGGSTGSTPSEFRKKYRNIDVLLIDDIQFIIGKESTQEEFFHTFNELYQSKKQIIISSDKSPKEFTNLEERLRSRFEMGLTTDIQLPSYETRMAILRKKGETERLAVSDDVFTYIAENIKSNIRELEGALNKVTAYARLFKREISLELAEEALKDIISPNSVNEINIDYIIDIVAEHFEITKEDIISKGKTKNIAYPRQICMYLSKTLTGLTFSEIGKKLGNRDHSTIMHGAEKIMKDLDKEKSKGKTELKDKLAVLTKKLSP